MRFALIIADYKPGAPACANQAKEWLLKKGQEVIIGQIDDKTDMVITFGGDGLILHAANMITEKGLQIPMIRVNFGTRGYLANVRPGDIIQRLKDVLEKNYVLSRRSRIMATLRRSGEDGQLSWDALNDIVIERRTTKAIDMVLTIDGQEQKRNGDGVIFATRTGSTAYNKKAFGPVLINEDDFIINLVSADEEGKPSHFVKPTDSSITLKVTKNGSRLVVDGKEKIPIKTRDRIFIQKCSMKTIFIEFNQ